MSFTNQIIYLPFKGWVYGLTTMIYSYNFVMSILLFKTRRTNVSNVLKIIFNFGGLFLYICSTWGLLVPSDVTLSECKSISYLRMLAHIIIKNALAAFLLWRLRQIEKNMIDNWIGVGLFFLRFGLHSASLFKIQPKRGYYAEGNAFYCIYGYEAGEIELAGALCFDLLIDFYVTLRLMQILAKANKNVLQISNITKRTLFTEIMYWNFVRSALAICDAAINLYSVVLGDQNQISIELQITLSTLQSVIAIFLSLAITADAEIVRIIEGKKKVMKESSGNSAGNGKSTKSLEKEKEKEKSIPQSSGSTLVSFHYQTSSEPPKYSAENYSHSN